MVKEFFVTYLLDVVSGVKEFFVTYLLDVSGERILCDIFIGCYLLDGERILCDIFIGC